MISVSKGCESLLKHRTFYFAICWQIERRDGTIFFFTDHNRPLLVDGAQYSPMDGFNSSAQQFEKKLEVSNFAADGIISDSALTESDLRLGLYDDAKLTKFIVDWRYPWAGKFEQRQFWLTRPTYSGEIWKAQAENISRWLTNKVGDAYTRNCRYKFGSKQCGALNIPEVGTITQITSQRQFKASGLTKADNYYNFGTIKQDSPPSGYTAIATPQQLQDIGNGATGNYILVNDIDLTGFNWTPLENFSGVFDGQGWTIKNLTFNDGNANGAGLFINFAGAPASTNVTIKNLELENFNLTAKRWVGALAGDFGSDAFINVTVENVHAKNITLTVGNPAPSAGESFGGLFGYILIDSFNIQSAQIKNCSVDGVTINSGSSTGTDGPWGGFAGFIDLYSRNVAIEKCYAHNVVMNKTSSVISYIGCFSGEIGMADNYGTGPLPYIKDCFAHLKSMNMGSTSVDRIGGFSGWISGPPSPPLSVQNCYFSSDSVIDYNGATYKGGFNGYLTNVVIIDCFWDTDTSGLLTSAGGTGKTTAEMKQQATYTNWDFDDVWRFAGGSIYPQLRGVLQKGPINQYDIYAGEVVSYLSSGAEHEIILFDKAPVTLQVGNEFRIFPGCDKLFATCRDKFNNVVNFGGFSFIPGSDAAMRTPRSKR